jgi:hypothetical protein
LAHVELQAQTRPPKSVSWDVPVAVTAGHGPRAGDGRCHVPCGVAIMGTGAAN